ncbi:MAG: rhomboid family intramembrane serine protease [Thermoplasmatota archaeon]
MIEIYSNVPTIIVSVMIIISLILLVLLPWKKGIPASIVLSISILAVFIIEFVLTNTITSDLPFIGGDLHGSKVFVWMDLGFWPEGVVDSLELHRFITSMFIHADFLHVLFNLAGLLFLGIQFENKVGWKRFLVIYFGSGILASCLVMITSEFDVLGQASNQVSIGASAGIMGILGAYWYLYPRDKVFFPLILIRKWSIQIIILIYLGISVVMLLLNPDDQVNHFAHFAGIVTAIPLAWILRPPPKEEEVKVKRSTAEALRALATTRKKNDILDRAVAADEKDVRDAWLEDFFLRVKCPKCGHSGMDYGGEIAECPACGNKIKP